MVTVADRVVVELEAKLDRYDANIRRAEQRFGSATDRISADARAAERQVTQSFGSIRKALLASTALFAGGAGASALKELADGYTRFTNQLKVAGVEGQNLGKVQDALYATAQRYGVQLETLGTLYSRVAQSGKELGASQSDILRFTNGVAAAIKVQGGSAAEAQGALLQLSQALGGQIVRAEEFNSVNEGARPILQAVANGIDKYGGSVAKLRQDVIAGKVTSQDFFQAFLKGSAQLESQAAKANLTIGASFVILNNALGKYIGETDQALSITARIGLGVKALADNLDVIAPALGGIAAGYVGVKAGAAAFDLVTAATARALAIDQATAAQIIKGNASYVSRTQLTLAQATAASETAAAEVAAIETTLAARKADQASIAQTLALLEAQRAESQAAAQQQAFNSRLNFGLGRAVTSPDADRERQDQRAVLNTRRALAAANAEVAATETALAGAQARAGAAATAETAAVTANTVAKRAGAVVNALFAGTLATIGAAIPFLVIAALTAAVISYASSAKQASFDSKAFAEEGETLTANLQLVDRYARGAASGIAQIGTQAASSTSQVRAFAGAVGDAAGRLEQLARARRRELFVALATDQERAKQQAAAAKERFTAASGTFNAKVGYIGRDENARNAALRDYNVAQARIRSSQEGIDRAVRTPLANYTTATEREGGRDVEGELARVTRDLTVARRRGLRGQVQTLEAQKFELDQYKKYRAEGLSPEAASAASRNDASDFRNADRGANADRDAKAGRSRQKSADAAARAADRKQAAIVRDTAADAARFASQERQANNQIAAAKAELTGSAVERANIEKARIEDERLNRNEELRQAAVQGQLGDGAERDTRLKELQALNDQRAALETQVVDLKERQRVAKDTLDVQTANLTNERDLLTVQQPLLDTNAQRKDAALRLLDLQYEQERIELRAITVANGRTETEEKIAQARLAQLDKLQGADRKAIDRQYEGPIGQYRRSLDDPRTQVEQAVADKLKSVDDAIADQAAKTLGIKDPFLKQLLQIFLQQNVLKPLYDSFSGAGGGGGLVGGLLGGLVSTQKSGGSAPGGLLGSIFGGIAGARGSKVSFGASTVGSFIKGIFGGRASGGHVNAGQMYRVTDGEGFIPAQSGKIVPLGRMNKAGGGSMNLYQTVKVDASNSVNPDGYADHIVSRVRGETTRIVAAGMQAVTKGVPARIGQYQRDGI